MLARKVVLLASGLSESTFVAPCNYPGDQFHLVNGIKIVNINLIFDKGIMLTVKLF